MRSFEQATLAVVLCLLCSCSKPLLVVDAATESAEVTFKNASGGHLQQFFFDDPVSCKGVKSIDYSLGPHQSSVHRIPAGRVVTIWTSAFGLPAPPGKFAWCRPGAFSTKLNPGQRYTLTFVADAQKESCGTVLVDHSWLPAPRVERRVEGPEIGGGGPLAGKFSCSSSDDLGSL